MISWDGKLDLWWKCQRCSFAHNNRVAVMWASFLSLDCRVPGEVQSLKALNSLGDGLSRPRQRPALGMEVTDDSQLLCSLILTRYKRERWLTPQTALESLTTIFNFKQATHKSWSLLLQTQPLGNHCLADINSLVAVKLPLKNATYFTPSPLTFQSRAWATWSKSRSGPALIPKLSISAKSVRNLRPEVRRVSGEGQELFISY